MNAKNVSAVAIAGLVVAAGFVGVVSPAVGTASERQVDACTTITEPGVYELGSDLTDTKSSEDACIEIESDDVVLDGGGHTVTMVDRDETYQTPYAVRATGVDNLTVTNLTAEGWGDAPVGRSLTVSDASDVTVTDFTVTGPGAWTGIAVQNATDVAVRRADLTGGGVRQNGAGSGDGVRFENVENAVVEDSDLQRWETGVKVDESSDVAVTDSTVGGSGDWTGREHGAQMGEGVDVDTSSDVTVRDNDVTVAFNGVVLRRLTTGVVVAGNNLSVNARGVLVTNVGESGEANVIRNNTMRNDTEGVYVVSTENPLYVVGNDLSDNHDGVHVAESRTCGPGPEGGELVTVRENTLANDDVGIENDGQNVVNATRNYWGAENGPSSVNDSDAPFGERDPEVPLEDPVTGELADGSGSAVTEFPAENESGISNVHFDPWLEAPPTASAAQDNSTA